MLSGYSRVDPSHSVYIRTYSSCWLHEGTKTLGISFPSHFSRTNINRIIKIQLARSFQPFLLQSSLISRQSVCENNFEEFLKIFITILLVKLQAMNYLLVVIVSAALLLIVPCFPQRTLDRPRSNFRFPSRLKVINNNDDTIHINSNNNNNNNGLVQHFPNPMAPGNSYGVPAVPVLDCICPCTKEYLPICGTDFRTYGNNCLFQCQRKCNPGLQFKACGTCEEPIPNLEIPCF